MADGRDDILDLIEAAADNVRSIAAASTFTAPSASSAAISTMETTMETTAADEGGYQGSKWGRGEGRRRETGCVVGAGRGVPSVCMCEMDAYMGRVRACVRGYGPGGRSLASVVFLPPSPRARAWRQAGPDREVRSQRLSNGMSM